MKLLGYRLSVCGAALALLPTLEMVACGRSGGGYSYSSITGYIGGAWQFTVTNAKGRVPLVIEANLTQDKHGIISSVGSVTASGPTGDVLNMFILGPSLSAATAVSVDYLGYTCNGTDSGDRSITGTLDPSNQVTLNLAVGGGEVDTLTGTLNNTASPPFTGTLTTKTVCGGTTSASVVGALAYPPNGLYTGTSASDSSEKISANITSANGSLTGTGSDSKLGNFMLTGNTVGSAFSATLTYTGSPANSGPVFGYLDRDLGPAGSILLVRFEGANVSTCPNGEPFYNSSCLIAILATD
ncbi:MAG TPA: hypothetical protein VGR47_06375 [Terracidiphilus sp.]|nr:hypothetical protein [Terracidiphilus sp.]